MARRVRAAFRGGKPVLVALTGYGDEGDRRQAREAGFGRLFTKPVDPAALGQLLVSWSASSDRQPPLQKSDAR